MVIGAPFGAALSPASLVVAVPLLGGARLDGPGLRLAEAIIPIGPMTLIRPGDHLWLSVFTSEYVGSGLMRQGCRGESATKWPGGRGRNWRQACARPGYGAGRP